MSGRRLGAFTRPVPDRDSAPWWEAVRRHQLLLQRCAGCATVRFPPRAVCNVCQTRDFSWIPSAGTGTVQSWIVNHHVFMRSAADSVPYVVALVRLDDADDLLMYGNLVAADDAGNTVAADPGTVTAGMPVEAVFIDVDPECTLVQWRPLAPQQTAFPGLPGLHQEEGRSSP